MEMFPDGWLSEFEMEEEGAVLMDSSDDLTPQQFAALYNEDFQRTFASSSNTSTIGSSFVQQAAEFCYERPTKQHNSAIGSGTTEQIKAPKVGEKNKRDGNPSTKSLCTLEHTIAERKRREKLTQQFIALSAIVPGLKKVDKVSVLGACMTYIKHLQTTVKELEEQTSKKTFESAVFVKKFQVPSNTDSLSSRDESSKDFPRKPIPVIEARISDRDVLIRIHCEKHKGVMAQTLLETEKLNLNVTSSSLVPFGNSTFDITVMAQMNAECGMTVKDLVKKLGSSLVLSQE